LGIVAFTIVYLAAVRWWTDILGRVIAGVFSATSAVLVVSTIRLINPDINGIYISVRALVYWLFGIAVWAGIGAFLWAQFMAPRGRTTRKEFFHEEAHLADRGNRDHGGLHDHSGRSD
jgi:MFS family permease